MRIQAIDSHIHIWNRNRGETFIAEKNFPSLIGKSFMPEDLLRMLRATNAECAVLVHGPSTVDHSHYCLELCAEHDMFLSVIGWVDVRASNVMKQLDLQSANKYFKGIRLTPLLDKNPVAQLSSKAVKRVAQALAEQDNVLEVLAPAQMLPSIAKLAQELPDLKIIIAHFGLPTGAFQDLQSWARNMAFLGDAKNVFVKVSGLPLTGNLTTDQKMIKFHFSELIKLCGPDRLLYASNWPVSTATNKPELWRSLLEQEIQELDVELDASHKILRQNALDIYA